MPHGGGHHGDDNNPDASKSKEPNKHNHAHHKHKHKKKNNDDGSRTKKALYGSMVNGKIREKAVNHCKMHEAS